MKQLKIDKSKLARYITSVVYVAVLCLLILFKWLFKSWGALGFDMLFCAISVIGCIEFLNAVKIVPYAQRALSIAFCATTVPLFVLCSMAGIGGYIPVAIDFAVFAIVAVIFGLSKLDGSNLKTTLLSLAAFGYCGILSCVFSAVNHTSENSGALVLLMFFIVMFTDSFAYLFGMLFKRWIPFKLAPKTSPNKTIIGGAGGLIGGMTAGVVAYWLWVGLSKLAALTGLSRIGGEALIYTGAMPACVAFLIIGFVGAIVAQGGDIFESFIKRKCGIKDMGKLLPGHGGVLDRFDSMLFVGVLVLIASFLLVI